MLQYGGKTLKNLPNLVILFVELHIVICTIIDNILEQIRLIKV